MVEEQPRITKEHLQSSVANEFSVKSDDVEIIKYDISPGCAEGDNFITVVKLVNFTYKLNGEEKSPHSYIVKQVPFNEMRKKLVREVRNY